jgi:ATP-dependent Clp protease ATP-binding subunit ClpA
MAKKWLAEHGYDTRFGARPLNRLIENEIARVLADEVLFGKLAKGGKVNIDVADDKLAFTYSETAAPVRGGGRAPAGRAGRKNKTDLIGGRGGVRAARGAGADGIQ